MPISKTDFVRALQCEKMLWLDAHLPEYKIIPPEAQARLNAGNEFGDQAMSVFGEYTETTTYREDGRLNFSAMLEKTQELLRSGERVICEGSFSWYGNFCAADILKKEEGGYVLYEVKNTHEIRKEFISDLGFQRLIIRKCGVPLLSSKLLLRGDVEEEERGEQVCVEFITRGDFRYKIADVTKEAKVMERAAEQRIFELGKLKRKDAEMPPIGVGAHCDHPYRCWYYEFCHGSN